MNPIPSVPKDLVEFLDALFSANNMAPRVSDSDREIWIKVGKRELIEYLKQTQKDQETGADEGHPHVFVHTSVDAAGADHDEQRASSDARTSTGTAGSYASPADRLRHFGE